MSGYNYLSSSDHLCHPPNASRFTADRQVECLAPGTIWTCPKCSLHYTVIREWPTLPTWITIGTAPLNPAALTPPAEP